MRRSDDWPSISADDFPQVVIEARLTQQELADMIGTTRETLAHTLANFKRPGLLDTVAHEVVIRDAERLAEIAAGETE
jgi:CRP/FNR family transcriptional regulator